MLFIRIRKIAKSDNQLRHVCPSVRMEQLGSHWTDFYEILIFEYFSEICREIASFIKIEQE